MDDPTLDTDDAAAVAVSARPLDKPHDYFDYPRDSAWVPQPSVAFLLHAPSGFSKVTQVFNLTEDLGLAIQQQQQQQQRQRQEQQGHHQKQQQEQKGQPFAEEKDDVFSQLAERLLAMRDGSAAPAVPVYTLEKKIWFYSSDLRCLDRDGTVVADVMCTAWRRWRIALPALPTLPTLPILPTLLPARARGRATTLGMKAVSQDRPEVVFRDGRALYLWRPAEGGGDAGDDGDEDFSSSAAAARGGPYEVADGKARPVGGFATEGGGKRGGGGGGGVEKTCALVLDTARLDDVIGIVTCAAMLNCARTGPFCK